MAFPQHSPPSSPVPSIFSTKSLLSHIFSQHFSPSLLGSTFHSIIIYLQCLNSLYPTQLISPLNMAKPPQPVSLHHFSNVINCQHAPHTLITFPFTYTHSCYPSQHPLHSLLCIFIISSIFVCHVSLPWPSICRPFTWLFTCLVSLNSHQHTASPMVDPLSHCVSLLPLL